MVLGGSDYSGDLLADVHSGLALPEGVNEVQLVRGPYLFYHYGCDGFDDRGWGCGYRTLMSLCSWMRGQLALSDNVVSPLPPVPSNRRIQEILVEIGDKESSFIESRQWIGSVEVSYVLDTLYNVPSKILHINHGHELQQHTNTLLQHFKTRGSPVMMGGDTDASSKGIMGICQGTSQAYLLVVDPHFWGVASTNKSLQEKEWIKWQPLPDFVQGSFYNMCLPQLTAVEMETK